MSKLMTIARPYAEAIFQYATEQDQVALWSTLLVDMTQIAENKDIQRITQSPKVSHEQVANVIAELTQVELASPQGSFVQLLIENKRLLCVPAIAQRYKQLVDEAHETLDVSMQTAVDVTPAEKESFTQKFSKMLGCNIKLHCTTDKDILGGFIVHYSDKVIDSSLKGQMNKMAQSLAE